jgi:hypothetical protein
MDDPASSPLPLKRNRGADPGRSPEDAPRLLTVPTRPLVQPSSICHFTVNEADASIEPPDGMSATT